MVREVFAGEALSTCPDCSTELNFTIEGFRPATHEERRRLTPETVRLLGLCPNPWCVGRAQTGAADAFGSKPPV